MGYIAESEELFYGNFRTYKIIKGDTLQTVSQKLGIEARELRRYHNIYCLDADVIEKDFKHHCHFVILAPEKNDSAPVNEEDSLKKVSLGKDNKLPFLPRGISRDYNVEYTLETGNQIDTMAMAVRVKWLATDKNNCHLFEIKRSVNLFIDDDLPDRMMDEMGTKMVEVLYPLKIVVDASGKWIDLYNYEEIVSRWEDKKKEVFDYYKKETLVSQEMIRFAEGALMSQEKLYDALRSDYFLRSFFNGIHTAYKENFLLTEEVSFPLEKNEESIFKTEQNIKPHLNNDSLIEVEYKGYYLNAEDEINFEKKMWEGKYNAMYYLNFYSGFIEKMTLECNIDYDEPVKVKLVIESLKKEKKE